MNAKEIILNAKENLLESDVNGEYPNVTFTLWFEDFQLDFDVEFEYNYTPEHVNASFGHCQDIIGDDLELYITEPLKNVTLYVESLDLSIPCQLSTEEFESLKSVILPIAEVGFLNQIKAEKR